MIKEKDFEEILCKYPELIEPDLEFKGRQIHLYGRRMDIIFEDRFKRTLIVELKIGPIKDEHIGQILSYEGILLSSDDPTIRVMLIGNRVPPNIRKSLDHHGIAWKEISIPSLKDFLNQKGDHDILNLFEHHDIAEHAFTRIRTTAQDAEMPDKSKHQVTWEKQYKILIEFRSEHPDRWPSQLEEYPKGNNLGVWCSSQRVIFKRGKLAQERIQLLSEIGFPFEKAARENAWMKQYGFLVRFREENPDRWPSTFEKYPKGNNLGVWFNKQKHLYNKDRLLPERVEKLKKIGLEKKAEISGDQEYVDHKSKQLELFINNHIEVDLTGNAYITKGELYERYKEWAKKNQNYIWNSARFSQAVFKKFSKVTPQNTKDPVTYKRIWRNLKFVDSKSDQAQSTGFDGSSALNDEMTVETFFKQFIEVDLEANVSILKGKLYAKYKEWCIKHQSYALSEIRFSQAVYRKYSKYTPKHSQNPSGKRIWRNLKLVDVKDDE